MELTGTAVRKEKRSYDAELRRARRIRRRLGTFAACSFLRERGWSFEAAYGAMMRIP
jgi:hypothetical protein